MDIIINIVTGGIGALFVLIIRYLITEGIKQSISYEYNQKLETHKNELETKIEEIRHENQLQQLRTSLFFDHQRKAFASIITKIEEVNQQWMHEKYDKENGLTEKVPYSQYKELESLYYKHYLFFDSNCVTSMELIFDYYKSTFPVRNNPEDDLIKAPYHKIETAYECVRFLQPRLAALFKSKIGINILGNTKKEIALLGSIKILNSYHFPDINLPVKGDLALNDQYSPGKAILKAEKNFDELINKLNEFLEYIEKSSGFFYDLRTKTKRYLVMLKSDNKNA